MPQPLADSLEMGINDYIEGAMQGVRSDAVIEKSSLHLHRFQKFFEQRYGQERRRCWPAVQEFSC